MSAGAWAAYRSRIAGRTSPTRSRKSPEIKPFCGHRSTYSRQAHCIKDRVLLEPACGCAEFSIAAAAHAAEVVCFDLDDQRFYISWSVIFMIKHSKNYFFRMNLQPSYLIFKYNLCL